MKIDLIHAASNCTLELTKIKIRVAMAVNKTVNVFGSFDTIQHFKGGLSHPPREILSKQGHQCADLRLALRRSEHCWPQHFT